MSSHNYIKDCQRLLDEMREVLLNVIDAKRSQLDLTKLDPEKVTVKEVKKLFHWLKELRENEFAAYLSAYSLVPPEIWDRYKLFDVSDLREQIILNETIVDLKAKWLNRPMQLKSSWIKGHERKSKRGAGQVKDDESGISEDCE